MNRAFLEPETWVVPEPEFVEPPVLLYFCYGFDQIYHQAVYSILSLWRVMGRSFGELRVVVYCDRPAMFGALPVEVVPIDDAMLDRWLDGGDYVHRRKTCVILNAMERFGGRLMFVDTDTYFRQSPVALFDRIGPRSVCFHILEGYIRSTATIPDRALVRQLEHHELSLLSGARVTVGLHTPMWNTGVVGVHAGDVELVREALALSDAIWATADPTAMDGRKIHHGEQFAMGFAFRDCIISEAAAEVYHYWPSPTKAAFNAILPELVASGLTDSSPANLDRLYRLRPRQTGIAAWRDGVKMGVRRLALSTGLSVRGVRRNVA